MYYSKVRYIRFSNNDPFACAHMTEKIGRAVTGAGLLNKHLVRKAVIGYANAIRRLRVESTQSRFKKAAVLNDFSAYDR